MALIHCNFYSQELFCGTDLNVIVPSPDSGEVSANADLRYFHPGAKFKVLYLLHGAFGDYSDWARLTSIERYAQEKHLVVVMPSAGNSFYQNMLHGGHYLDYFTKELPAFVATLFPVSDKREDTFVAGLSMGGYGAYKLALENPERFSAAISLSGAIDIENIMQAPQNERIFSCDNLFGGFEKINGSRIDLFALIRHHQENGVELPRFFQSCGTEDFIYQSNLGAKAKLEALGVDLTYEEHPGVHNWDYWDANIQRALEWLNL